MPEGSPSSWVAQARQLFDLDAHATVISAPHITFTVTRRPLPGLGDQAMVQIYQPGKNVVPPLADVVVDVRSHNAEFFVTFNIALPGVQPPPTNAELVSETIAIARDVLAAGQGARPMAHRSGQEVTGNTSAQVPADGTGGSR